MFNNSNSLPIALMQSLVVTVKGLKWGDDDTKDQVGLLEYLASYGIGTDYAFKDDGSCFGLLRALEVHRSFLFASLPILIPVLCVVLLEWPYVSPLLQTNAVSHLSYSLAAKMVIRSPSPL
jgi:hypothetical protein